MGGIGGKTVVAGFDQGSLLLQARQSAAVLVSGDQAPSTLGKFQAYAFSPDGTEIVATTESTRSYSGSPGSETYVGSTYEDQLLLLDLTGTVRQVLLRAASDESLLGPIAWSPDGSQIAFRLATFGRDVSRGSPGSTSETDQACVVTLQGKEKNCLSDLHSVNFLAWDPRGTELAIQQTGDEPIVSWNPATGGTRTLVPAGGGQEINAALHGMELGDAVIITNPLWSPSGRHLAVDIQSIPGGSVPAILALDGTVEAIGTPNDGPQILAWQPGEDVLSYTVGKYFPAQGWGVETITPAQSKPSVVLSEEGLADPRISSMAWSPDGATLAVGHAQGAIQLVPVRTGGEVTTLSADGVLVGWGP